MTEICVPLWGKKKASAGPIALTPTSSASVYVAIGTTLRPAYAFAIPDHPQKIARGTSTMGAAIAPFPLKLMCKGSLDGP